MYCDQCVHGFGDLGDVSDFFSDNIWGQALFKLGVGAAGAASTALIQDALKPDPARLGSGQIIYAPYNTSPGVASPATPTQSVNPAAPGGIPPATGTSAATFQLAPTDYTPWILAGAGALVLLALLRRK